MNKVVECAKEKKEDPPRVGSLWKGTASGSYYMWTDKGLLYLEHGSFHSEDNPLTDYPGGYVKVSCVTITDNE